MVDRTLVPLRFIGESLGADVHWDGARRSVTIRSKEKIAPIAEITAEYSDLVLRDSMYEDRWLEADVSQKGRIEIRGQWDRGAQLRLQLVGHGDTEGDVFTLAPITVKRDGSVELNTAINGRAGYQQASELSVWQNIDGRWKHVWVVMMEGTKDGGLRFDIAKDVWDQNIKMITDMGRPVSRDTEIIAGDRSAANVQVIKNKAEEITKGLETDYEKMRAIHVWICGNIAYHYGGGDSVARTSIDTLRAGKGVCDGISALNADLLRAVGIPARRPMGHGIVYSGDFRPLWRTTSRNFNHGWVAAFVDGRWAISDSTWGGFISYVNGGYSGFHHEITHFDMTMGQLSNRHLITTVRY